MKIITKNRSPIISIRPENSRLLEDVIGVFFVKCPNWSVRDEPEKQSAVWVKQIIYTYKLLIGSFIAKSLVFFRKQVGFSMYGLRHDVQRRDVRIEITVIIIIIIIVIQPNKRREYRLFTWRTPVFLHGCTTAAVAESPPEIFSRRV